MNDNLVHHLIWRLYIYYCTHYVLRRGIERTIIVPLSLAMPGPPTIPREQPWSWNWGLFASHPKSSKSVRIGCPKNFPHITSPGLVVMIWDRRGSPILWSQEGVWEVLSRGIKHGRLAPFAECTIDIIIRTKCFVVDRHWSSLLQVICWVGKCHLQVKEARLKKQKNVRLQLCWKAWAYVPGVLDYESSSRHFSLRHCCGFVPKYYPRDLPRLRETQNIRNSAWFGDQYWRKRGQYLLIRESYIKLTLRMVRRNWPFKQNEATDNWSFHIEI